MTQKERYPIQFEMMPVTDKTSVQQILFLCNDGTVWMLELGENGSHWTQMSDVPQPPKPEEIYEDLGDY